MIGAYFVFGAVLAIVTTYMVIVHKFLAEGELPEDAAREAKYRGGTIKPSSSKSDPSHSVLDPKTA